MTGETKISGRFLKWEICAMYKISSSTLCKLLNEKYYAALAPFSYEKNQKDLSPKQFEIFKEIYGEPEIDIRRKDKKDS